MAGRLHVYLCAHELVNASSVEEFDCAATRGGSSRQQTLLDEKEGDLTCAQEKNRRESGSAGKVLVLVVL